MPQTLHSERLFETKYGYFSEDGREYVITRPDTPRPWVNVLSNGNYSLVISQTGGGFSWFKNSNLNAITIWRQDLIKDDVGKFLYIRDRDSGRYWSVGWKPVYRTPQAYTCRHGIGYSIICSRNEDIESELVVFIPQDSSLEIWKVTLRNHSSARRNLSLFSYLEWCLGVFPETHREFHKTFIETQFDANLNTLWARNRLWEVRNSKGMHRNRDWEFLAFHGVNQQVSSFEGDKETFLGRYRSEANPLALERGILTNTDGKWNDSVASLHVDVTLDPGEEKSIIFTLGAVEIKDEKEAIERIKHYQELSKADLALEETKAFWEKLLQTPRVETPDRAFDTLTNIWLKYQAISGRLWARAAYYQQSGGYGFRDQLQDSQIFLSINPAKTREQIFLHAQHQFVDGTVYHWWHNLSEEGPATRISDDLLWLPYVVLNYLKETTDFSILDEKVRYIDAEEDSLYNHCCRAIDCVLTRFSPRGLPLIGEGDWNDGLNGLGCDMKGESIWLGHFLYGILQEFALVAQGKGDDGRARRYRTRAARLRKAINELTWDGNWYLRATGDDGRILGSAQNSEARIFLNAQTWAVINGVADPNRAERAMNSVEEILDREYGPLLFYPAFTHADEAIGYLSRYAPGVRENGGLYTHAATWAIMAECILGRGERAYQMYTKLCPINRGMNPDLYFCEPYVTPGNVEGPDSPHFGRGGWTWYTGSAAWLFQVCVEWILGIRPTYDGLLIDPCIPKHWENFKMKRLFRGDVYEIEVVNPNHVNKGVVELVIDGRSQKSNLVTPFKNGEIHRVRVIMG